MKNCKYYLKNGDGTPKTYQELVDQFNELSQTDKDTIIDCLYQLVNSRQEQIKTRLFEIKDKNKANITPKGDPSELGNVEITFDQVDNKKVWSTQTFIDSRYFTNLDGSRIILPFNRKEYIDHIIAQNKDTLGEEQARNLAEQTVAHWDIIAKDSPLVHELFTKRWANIDALKERLKGTKYEDLVSQIYDLTNGSSNIWKTKIFREFVPGTTKIISDLNLKCKLLGIDQEIIGHIDNLIIDDSGDLHIINYKVSTSAIDDVKKEKYMYQLALLKQMLANEGFNVEHMTLSIIPIRITYNDDFSKVTSMTVMDKTEFTVKDGKYKFGNYDIVARRFIGSTARINTITTDQVKKVDYALKVLFPDKNITSHGIEVTVDEWIKAHNRVDIQPSNKPNVAWTVFFSKDDIVEISDPTDPLKNEKIKEEVKKRISNLQIGNSYLGAHAILKKIKTWYQKGTMSSFSEEKEFLRCGKYFDKLLAPYLYRRPIKGREGEYEYDWEPIENDLLQNENIIIFRNKVTGQLDVITISPYNLNAVAKMRDKYTNILGQYIGDNTAISQNIMKSNYGNIEAIRTMFLLNEVLQEIEGDYKLGTLQIVSPENLDGGKIYTFQNIISQFTKVLGTLVKEKQIEKSDYRNNFSGKKFIDSVQAFLLMKDHALQDSLLTNTDKTNLKDWGLEILEESNSRETKLMALKTLMKSMQDIDGGWGIPSNLEAINAWASRSPENRMKAQLFLALNEAILQYSGIREQLDLNESDMSSMQSYMQSSSNIASVNARVVTSLFARAADRVATESYKDSIPVQKYITEFYKAAGYTNLRNSSVGFQTRVFTNLFEEVNGKKTMRFKNPYTDTTLKSYEAKFLKQVLFTIAGIRKKMFPRLKFDFTSAFDPKLAEFASNPENSWYLEVPLTKANLASRRATGYTFRESWNRLKNVMSKQGMTQNFQEFFEGLTTEEEVQRVQNDLQRLSVTNHFAWYETLNAHGGANQRASMLNQKDPDFFESNVETLLMSFIESQHEMEQMNDVLIQSKAILLTLSAVGDVGNPRLKNIIKYITDYLTVNVFNKSIMEEDTKKVIGTLAPAKHLATTVYILGNLASAVRDTTEGLLHNMTRSVIKFQTNITSKELSRAYGIVFKEGTFSNVRTMNILNQLNIKYRISNVDLARIQEVLATGRSGLDNAENWAYATLRRPDFLNRMTLFVAKLIHDGVWDALSIKDGELIYDWTQDERFKYYALHKDNPPSNDEKYLKQKGAYFSAILEYNREHPHAPLNIQDPNVKLPQPYTSEYVESIKALSNSIYGSYDKSTKAMYEHIAIGQALGQFTTWMNGMIGNYWRKPGSPTGELKEEYSFNEFGEQEFFDEYGNIVVQKEREDGTKYYLNETTNQEWTGQVLPVLKHVPITSQGIIYSIINLAAKIVPVGYKRNGLAGAWEEIKKEIILNPQELKNFRKLFSDIFMWLLIGSLYAYVVDPWYEDLKKNRDHKDFLCNTFEDVVYKGTASSYDGFRGPWNVIDSFGNNMNPPAYKVTTKMATDSVKTVFGDKTFGQLITQNAPLLRSFRTAYDTYVKG